MAGFVLFKTVFYITAEKHRADTTVFVSFELVSSLHPPV